MGWLKTLSTIGTAALLLNALPVHATSHDGLAGVWRLTQMDGVSVGSTLTLRFVGDAIPLGPALIPRTITVRGTGACNDYIASHTRYAARGLRIWAVAPSLVLCDAQQDMQTDQAYFERLEAVSTFQVEGNSLSLFDSSGAEVLRFMSAEHRLLMPLITRR
jgi:META domain